MDIAERKAFLEFDAIDSGLMSALHGQLEPFRHDITQSFFGHLADFEPLRRLMGVAPSLERLHHVQAEYFSRLTVGDYGNDFVADCLRVGHVHQRIGLPPKWYIGAYRKYLSELVPLVWAQCEGDSQRFLELCDSLLKVVLFDMGLVLDSYFDADRQALLELKDYADGIIATMPSGLLVLDAKLRLRTINVAARDMLGLDESVPLAGLELGKLLASPTLLVTAAEVLEKRQMGRLLTLGPLPGLCARILVLTLSTTLVDGAQGLIVQLEDETESIQSEERMVRFRTAMDASDDAIFLIDRLTLSFVDINASACNHLGYSRGELLEMGLLDFKSPLSEEALTQRFDRMLAEPGRTCRDETVYRRKDGSSFEVEVVYRAFHSEGRAMLVAIARDIGPRKRAEESLRIAQRALTAAANGIVITDCLKPDNPIVYVNPAFERITGYDAAEAIGRNGRFLHGDDRDQPGITVLKQAVHDGQEARLVLRNYRKDGTPFWNELYISPIRNEAGTVTHYVGVQSDITEQKQAEENLRHMATHDALTGLPNRALLHDRVGQAISYAERTKSEVAVLFIDIDRFKNINDSLGHAVGDQLITRLGRRLQEAVRKVDTVARMGGDEFVIILTDIAHESDILQLLPDLLASIAQPILIDGHELSVTASIGISLYPNDGLDVSTLLKNADTAMYRAKDAGRSVFRYYTQEMNADAIDHLRLENDLRHAIKAGELIVYYQPQIESGTGRIVAAEALLRWNHPRHGLISPDQFIPLAEETGLILPIGEWVLRQVCTQVHDWRAAGLLKLKIAVNLSPRQFQQYDIVDMIRSCLDEHDLPSDWLELEITESSLMQDPETAVVLLEELVQQGFHLAVDDFGTGYSSLAYLKRFPLHALKIDRSFVIDIETNRDSAAIASAIIALAHKLELKVIAEGVEFESQMEFLYALGCDMAQGYLFGRPMPGDEFMALIGRQAC